MAPARTSLPCLSPTEDAMKAVAFNQRAILLASIVFLAITSLYYSRDVMVLGGSSSFSSAAPRASLASQMPPRLHHHIARNKAFGDCTTRPPIESKGARVLVTGVAGMLGSRVAQYCSAELGMHVVGIDDLSGGFESNVPKGIVFLKGDLRNRVFVRRVFEAHGPFKYIYHMAGYSDTEASHFARMFNYETNLVAGVFLINQALNKSVDAFVFASSVVVYGPGNHTPDESDVAHPSDPVGVSKLAMEMDLASAHARFGLDYVILRLGDLYGPGQHLANHNEIASFFRSALTKTKFSVYGTDDAPRSVAFVGDVASLVARSPLLREARNQIINVASSQYLRPQAMAQAVASAMEVPSVQIEHIALPHEAALLRVLPKTDKAQCLLGASAKETPLAHGIAEMAQWVKANSQAALEANAQATALEAYPAGARGSFLGGESSSAQVATWSPTSPTTPAPTRPRIFYFGVTHSSSVHRAISVDQTWGERAMPGGMPWYSNKPEPRLKNVTVLVPPEGDSYAMIYYRMLLIWKHVWKTYPGYDWYMRLWDDNLIIVERVEQVSLNYNPEELVEIGRPRYGETTWPGGKYVPQFMGGGASALTSRALVKKFVENIHSCPREITAQEDVTISICVTNLGAKYHRHYGFLPHCPRPAGELNVYPSDLSCRRRYREFGGEPFEHFVTFHYVKEPEHMKLFYDAIYNVPCGQAKSRNEEMRIYGRGPTGMVEV